MLSRFFVVTIAYLLSLPGLIMALAMVAEELKSPRSVFVLAVCWAVTVVMHFMSHIAMSFAWVLDLRVGKVGALTGAVLTVIGFLAYPLFQSVHAHGWSEALQSMALFWAYGGLFLAPYWGLGGCLFLFHGGQSSETAEAYKSDTAL
ncbi:hypothetical protein RAE19_06375 [Rhodoferax sp. TBRC 17660]|uniref:Uncharacterized protein n=1 Tax=Rhodoferax potami TaxID=3068338 RepID=A0ABU3KLN4_9BURK|nr:hypothetical protein [Rhodoferax sp. TBRC 17660]MDT7518358.1 hypothetical protein [Rhodoferax sp. TBRC 17660]